MSTSCGFTSFTDAIAFQARLDPLSVAVCLNSREIGYAAFWNDIGKVTGHLQAHGLPRGTRVAVHVQHLYLRWLAILALARLGLVSASLSDSPQEFELLAPQVVISDAAFTAPGASVIQAGDHWLDGEHDAAFDRRDDPHPDAPCRLVVSSGTTGTPKKAVLTRRDVHERLRANARTYGLHPGVSLATTMSTQAIGGFTMPLSCWAAGGAVVMASVPASHALLHLLRLRPQVLFLSVVQLAELMDTLPPEYQAAYQPRIYVAGSAIPPALSRSVRLRVTQSLFVVYGSTEAGTVTIAHAARAQERPGFTGHVVPSAQVEIVDERHRVLPAGQPGEVRIRAEGMIRRYEDDAGADANFRKGWFYPGDAGILDETGGLVIVGRTREVMNFGGVKLAPEAVEHALHDCPGVIEFAAFSLVAGGRQLPWVAVVAGDDFSNEAMAGRFGAAFPGLPALSIARLEQLPRNAMGKVLRGQLAAMVGTALAGNEAAQPQPAGAGSSA
ncbi:MAG: class I adenylate-forming enzyme family protein [Ramlibacter sp.]